MSQAKPKKDTVTLYVCRFCGKVGLNLQPSTVEFGGCAPPNTAHIFQSFEVVVKPKA